MMPEHYRPLHSAEQIATEIRRVGAEIDAWTGKKCDTSRTDLLVLPVMRGGMIFSADLVRVLTHSVEIVPVRAKAYRTDSNEAGSEVKLDLSEVQAKGRSILLLDDICDTGRTLKVTSAALIAAGAVEVKSAVLIRRILKAPAEYDPDWVCFEYRGPEWIVGYGMDDCDRWRNLPFTGIITRK